ncbi:MAG: hypothetical protein ACLFQX_04070 [Candidatus Kapaibacterium sp.]
MPTETIDLHIYFTDAEIAEKARKLSQWLHRIDAMNRGKKNAADHFKSRIGEAETEIAEISSDIKLGYRTEPRECDVSFDYATNEKIYYDPETGEELKREKIPQQHGMNSMFSRDEEIEEAEYKALPAHEEVLED